MLDGHPDPLRKVTLSVAAICAERLVRADRISLLALATGPRARTEAAVVACRGDPAAVGLAIDLRRYPEIVAALDSGELVMIDDVRTDPRMTSVRDRLPPQVRSVLALPLGGDGEILGVLHVRSPSSLLLDEGARAALLEVGRSAGRALAADTWPTGAPELAGAAELALDVARLQGLLLTRGDLVKHSIHDLRGALNILAIAADLLLKGSDGALGPPQAGLVTRIQTQVKRLVTLITVLQSGAAVATAAQAIPADPAGPHSPLAVRPRLLIVDDDDTAREAIARQLEGRGYEVRELGDAAAAAEEIRLDPPDLALLDVRLPGMDGFALAEQLARDPRTVDVPVLFLSDWDTVEDRVRGLALGADDFLSKPVDEQELAARVARSLRHATVHRQLRAEAGLDGLTRIANYRVFCERLRDEEARARQRREPLSLVVLDVDELKRLNDEHGHDAGNRALQDLGAALAAGARHGDCVARYGGDEFVALLPGTKAADALGFAERILADFAARVAARDTSCSVSAGVASIVDGSSGASLELFEQADAALYRAKHAGGARAVLADPAAAGGRVAGT